MSSLKSLVTTVTGGTSPLLWTASNAISYNNSYSPVHVAGLLPSGSSAHVPLSFDSSCSCNSYGLLFARCVGRCHERNAIVINEIIQDLLQCSRISLRASRRNVLPVQTRSDRLQSMDQSQGPGCTRRSLDWAHTRTMPTGSSSRHRSHNHRNQMIR